MKQIIKIHSFLGAGGVLQGWVTEENSWQNVFSGKNILKGYDYKFSRNSKKIKNFVDSSLLQYSLCYSQCLERQQHEG